MAEPALQQGFSGAPPSSRLAREAVMPEVVHALVDAYIASGRRYRVAVRAAAHDLGLPYWKVRRTTREHPAAPVP